MASKFALLSVVFGLSILPKPHEFYVSITYLKSDGEQELQIRHRIFKDDLEMAVGLISPLSDGMIEQSVQDKIFNYLEKCATVLINGSALTTDRDLILVEGEGVTCTIECRRMVTLPEVSGSLIFDNRILLDVLDDQINMTHFIPIEGRRRSENLDARLTQFKIR